MVGTNTPIMWNVIKVIFNVFHDIMVTISFVDERFQMEQIISDWPYGIDRDYIVAAKPQGVLRYWIKSESNRKSVDFDIEISVAFVKGTKENAKVGEVQTLSERDIGPQRKLNEVTHLLPDLSSIDFDKMM